jgi:putative membrane protein
MAMGAADLVPGVSGGTIALITNIYEDLIATINKVTAKEIVNLLGSKRKKAWQRLNGPFIVPLFLGIATSVLFLSSLIRFFLESHALALWSFFLGLIVASATLICKQIQRWSATTCSGLAIGFLVSFLISFLTPTESIDTLPYLFMCGMLMIMAMILPGISGAFILVLLGAYETALETVELLRAFKKEGVINLLAFGSGAVIGLKIFAHWVGKLYKNYRNVLLATMSGFMFGSLYKVWPWKKKSAIDEEVTEIATFPTLSFDNPEIWVGIAFIGVGIGVIYTFDILSRENKK